MAVGTAGAWGLLIYAIVLGIGCNVPCPEHSQLCIYNPNKEQFYVDNVDTWVEQLGENPALIGALFINILAVALLNYFGQAITKYINAVTRMLNNALRATLVWLVGIIVTVAQPNDPIWKPWENTDWRNMLLQLTGFLFLILSLIIHRAMIKLPYKDRFLHDIVVPCECCKCSKTMRELEAK